MHVVAGTALCRAYPSLQSFVGCSKGVGCVLVSSDGDQTSFGNQHRTPERERDVVWDFMVKKFSHFWQKICL
jgi:hypothetical protein